MHFMTSGPEVIQAIHQRWLFNEWKTLKAEAALPSWGALKAETLSRIVDSLMFCDVTAVEGAPRFYIRYMGAKVVRLYGSDFKDRPLDEALPRIWRPDALTAYRQAVESRRPVYNAVATRDRNGRLVHLENLLLPFSRNGTDADRVLASVEAISYEGAFALDNLGASPHASSTSVLAAMVATE